MSVLRALQATSEEQLLASEKQLIESAEAKIDSTSDHARPMVVSEINEA